MAEKSAEWYEKQISQYKLELDELNPKLNVANARVVELEGQVAELAANANLLQDELRRYGDERLRLQGENAKTEKAFRAFAAASDAHIAELKADIKSLNEAGRAFTPGLAE